jgi:type VI secretion system protein ImpK
MSSSPAVSGRPARINNLALAFQEPLTVILRTRFRTQQVGDAESFRAVIRKMISSAVNESRALGYADDISKMAIYAIVGFLDESILSSGDPVFADWAKRPEQGEMFGSQVAGELFFRNVADLLNRPASAEVADVLELHALCLLLGYRGRFAVGDATEIHTILRRIRDKIGSIRGESELFRQMEAPPIQKTSQRDPWVRRLTIAALITASATLLLYVGYILLLGQSVPAAAQSSLGVHPEPSGLTAQSCLEKLA